MGLTESDFTVAVIGAGGMASEHIKAFSDIPHTRVVGLHSRTRTRAEGLAKSCGAECVADSVEELYDRTRADLVIIAVPELAARTVATAAFSFPWACLMEKPAGYDLADATAIAEASRDRRVFVALNRRFNSSTRTAVQGLDGSDARFINIFDQQNVEDALGMGHPKVVAENFMYANSVHVIDLFRVFGRGAVTAVTPLIPWDIERPRMVLATVDFESGDRGLYQAIWDGPGPWAAVVTTPAERWELRPLEEAAVQKRGTRTLVKMEVDPLDRDFKPGFRRQAQAVRDAVVDGTTGAPTIADALETMKLIARLYGHLS